LPPRLKLWLPILLLFSLTALAAAPRPDGPAIVLQLPPGMSADQARDLVAGLRDQGATIAPASERRRQARPTNRGPTGHRVQPAPTSKPPGT
jgi:hypothetical protein